MDKEAVNSINVSKSGYIDGSDQHFGPGPIHKEFPSSQPAQNAPIPFLPKILNGEMHDLSDHWSGILTASRYRNIVSVLSIQEEVEFDQYKWKEVILHPLHGRSGVYGETGETPTMNSYIGIGNMNGFNAGMRMPRGFKENMKKHTILWNWQLKANLDMLERIEQYGIFQCVLNNKDQFKLWIRRNETLRGYTVERYLEEFSYPFVNVMRKNNGWVKLANHSNYMLQKYYSEMDNIGTKNWVYLTTFESDSNVKLEKQENLLYLFRGDEKAKAPRSSIYEYSTTNIRGDAVYVLPNFVTENYPLGNNMLTANYEFSGYTRFKPYNLLGYDKELIKDRGPKSYDLSITNDNLRESKDRISYKEVATKLIDIHSNTLLRHAGGGVDNKDSTFYNLCNFYLGNGKNSKKINCEKYIHSLLSQLGIPDIIEQLRDDAYNGKVTWIRETIDYRTVDNSVYNNKFYLQLRRKITEFMEMFIKNVGNGQESINFLLLAILYEIKKWSNNDEREKNFEIVNNLERDIRQGKLAIQNYTNTINDIDTKLNQEGISEDIKNSLKKEKEKKKEKIKNIGLDIEDRNEEIIELNRMAEKIYIDDNDPLNDTLNDISKTLNPNSQMTFITELLLILKNNNKILKPVLDILKDMITKGFDLPFGIILLSRKIIECDCTLKIKTKSVNQFVTKLMPIGSVEYPSGELHITIFRKYGQHIQNSRNILKAHKTLLRKCISGGKNVIYDKDDNNIDDEDEEEEEINQVKYTLMQGDLFPVPVKLEYVIRPRQKMINRFGFDGDEWKEIVGVIKKEGNSAYFQPVLQPQNNVFNWERETTEHKDISDYFINKNNNYIPDQNHFASWQLNHFDNSIEKELGQLENHHLWWKNENVILHVENHS